LHEFADGRKLRFDVEVTMGDRVIGTGRHERRIIRID
jgi:predicted thioesterase